MGVNNQKITNTYAIYNGDCIEVMRDMKKDSIDLSVYSPPFCGLYHYSSSPRDLSNADTYEDFFKHYKFVVQELFRLTKDGRCTAVHCSDIPSGNSGKDCLVDFPGGIIDIHKEIGFDYIARHCIWKEPFAVRNRTMQKSLAHKTAVDDSIYCGVASADYLLIFRKKGENKIPVTHKKGFDIYHGSRIMPTKILKYKNYKGKQTKNIYSHWIWRQYASSFWDDIRLSNVLQYKKAREEDDEKHVHPLQLDVINRIIALRTNPKEVILTPFMGVGSEVYAAISNNRKGIGIELKKSYYKQAVKNIRLAKIKSKQNKKLLNNI